MELFIRLRAAVAPGLPAPEEQAKHPSPNAPGTPETVNREESAGLRLTDAGIDDIVAFLGTLTDGDRP